MQITPCAHNARLVRQTRILRGGEAVNWNGTQTEKTKNRQRNAKKWKKSTAMRQKKGES